jgi:hypothetical protein
MTARSRIATGLLFAALLLLGPHAARAESVLFVSSEERTAELLPELTLAVRSHGLLLLARGLGDARTPLERAAAAQRIGRNVGTWAALWIERETPLRVRAVAASGERIHEAPLPAPLETIEPRVFASVATSVLLEVLGKADEQTTPQAGQTVDAASAAPLATPAWAREGTLPALASWGGPRFFLRAGVGYGLVHVGDGARPDREPVALLDGVAASSRRADQSLDLAAAQALLRAGGYDCHVAADAESRLKVDQCKVAAKPGGFVSSFAFDLAAGARLWPRLALSLTARIAPVAGRGALAHALFGMQLEGSLLEPRRTGLWLHVLAGGGLGWIEARPAAHGAAATRPYATTGPGNVRAGLQLGYRFTEQLGLYAGSTLHVGLPYRLFAIDPTLGVEARL